MNTKVTKSFNFERKPTTVEEIKKLIDDTSRLTYSRYLKQVLQIAEIKAKSVGQTLQDVEFTIDEDGMIFPFGETYLPNDHPYNTNPASCLGQNS